MFIAMNRFRIVRGKEAEFERVWAERVDPDLICQTNFSYLRRAG
jgi:hypothetical protein